MKKNINEIETLINKVIDKKRSLNMTDDANILESKLDFFLKGFKEGSGLHFSTYYLYYLDEKKKNIYEWIDEENQIRKRFLLNEDGEIDVPEEWITFFEEELVYNEYQNYLKLKDKFDPIETNKFDPIETNNSKPDTKLDTNEEVDSANIYISMIIVLVVLFFLFIITLNS